MVPGAWDMALLERWHGERQLLASQAPGLLAAGKEPTVVSISGAAARAEAAQWRSLSAAAACPAGLRAQQEHVGGSQRGPEGRSERRCEGRQEER